MQRVQRRCNTNDRVSHDVSDAAGCDVGCCGWIWMGLDGVVGDWENSIESGEAAVMISGMIVVIERQRKSDG